MKFFLIPLLLIAVHGYSQCKSYRLSRNGDTLNCVDMNDLEQGKWVVKAEGLRGEPGYETEGIFKDGKKEGLWRSYTSMGDLFAVEQYRWGNQDGISQYYSIAGLVREESWKAVNPENPYDTIEVPDPVNPYKVEMKVVKIEGSTVKHGSWKYYDVATGRIIKTENYILNKLETPSSMILPMDGTDTEGKGVVAQKQPNENKKPPQVLEFEKKNAGKKKVKVIDGRTGPQ